MITSDLSTKTIFYRNALGSHWDGEDPELRNVENECYCMEDKGCQILFIFISNEKNKCYCMEDEDLFCHRLPLLQVWCDEHGSLQDHWVVTHWSPYCSFGPAFLSGRLDDDNFCIALHFCFWTTTKSKLKLKLFTVLNVQADQSFRDAVIGMKPDKEKHQMYVSFFYTILWFRLSLCSWFRMCTTWIILSSRYADIHPKFGFPLAFRPKFQLNAILRQDTHK